MIAPRYALSKREKVLAGCLAVILLLVAWYFLIFQNCATQVAAYNGQAADAQARIDVDQAKLAKMNAMQKVVDQKKASGATQVIVPKYDNLANVMAQLSSALSASSGYTLTFDAVDASGAMVSRGVKVAFTCDSYDQAKSIIEALQNGPYSCSIDSLSFAQSAASASSGSSGGSSSAVVHIVYYESK